MRLITIIIIMVIILFGILCLLVDLDNRNYSVSKDNLSVLNYYLDILRSTKNEGKKNIGNIPVFVINLPRSTVRKNHILRQKDKFALNITFIKAINGRKILNLKKGITEDGTFFSNNDSSLLPGELGCTLSHLKAIRKAYDLNYDKVLILEDDVSFELIPLWENPLENIINNAPEDWEFLSIYKSCNKKSPEDYFLYRKHKCWGALAYVINRKGMEKIVNNYFKNNVWVLNKKTQKCRNVADEIIPFLLNSYCYKRSLFIPMNNYGDMNSTIHPEHTYMHIKETLSNLRPYYLDMSKKANIPKILHLIWIGPKPPPKTLQSWTRNFSQHNPEWIVKVWRDKEIAELNLVNQISYDQMGEWCGKADIARYEILYRHGGMYIDADTIWLGDEIHPEMLRGLFNVFLEKEDCISNGWIACIPNHPFLKMIIDSIPESMRKNKPAWISTGPHLIYDLYEKLMNNNEKYIDSLDINFVKKDLVLCPAGKKGWHGIDKNNYDEVLRRCQQEGKAFAFHWGFSTNKFKVSN